MPSSHLILCHPLLLLPPIPPSIRVFSNESTLHMRWSKYWSFSFSISPSKEHPGLRKWQKSPLPVGIKGNAFVFYYCYNKLSVTQELNTNVLSYSLSKIWQVSPGWNQNTGRAACLLETLGRMYVFAFPGLWPHSFILTTCNSGLKPLYMTSFWPPLL